MPLPNNCIKISNSATGKCRVIERKRILVAEDLKVINLLTLRRFFEPDENDVDGLGAELTGMVDFQPYERTLTASNERLCNPENGLTVIQSGDTYVDVVGNIVANPVGLFDFFKPFLDQPVAINAIANQQIINEDQVYKTWDK